MGNLNLQTLKQKINLIETRINLETILVVYTYVTLIQYFTKYTQKITNNINIKTTFQLRVRSLIRKSST